jgi:hypothetical protein
VPEWRLPGPHTVELAVAASLPRRTDKYYTDTCNPGGPSPSYDPSAIEVGWVQVEIDGDPCYAAVMQVALAFDRAPLDRIQDKTINRAVLAYDEVPSTGCETSPGPDPTCWRSGGSSPEDNPGGCGVVRVPSVDWPNVAPPPGLIPYLTGPRPAVARLGTRKVEAPPPNLVSEWDVTEPFTWEYDPSKYVPLGGAEVGHGLLLSGGPSMDQLEAEDNTSCASLLSNIRLAVTYTVPEGGGDGPVVN